MKFRQDFQAQLQGLFSTMRQTWFVNVISKQLLMLYHNVKIDHLESALFFFSYDGRFFYLCRFPISNEVKN